jgi:hypothetical protein
MRTSRFIGVYFHVGSDIRGGTTLLPGAGLFLGRRRRPFCCSGLLSGLRGHARAVWCR